MAFRKVKSGLVQFSVKKAHQAQLRTSRLVVRRDTLPKKIHSVAGVDLAYIAKTAIAAAAVLNYDTLSIIEEQVSLVEADFPYIPTLLSFRELPPAIRVVRKLASSPDVLLIDGHGVMHPYGLGFASHLGVALNKPTIGVAKSPLVGRIGKFNDENWAPMKHKGEVVGVALVTKKRAKPVYVSIGHLISLRRAVEIVKHCILNHRIPEPTRLAHALAARKKKDTSE